MTEIIAPGPALAGAVAACPASGIREIANAASAMPDAVRLDLGQPDFATPAHIRHAATAAMEAGWTGYTHTQGLPSLRELIADKVRRVNGFTVGVEEITCAGGGVGAIAAAFAAVLEPGDEVLLPDPAWPNYRMMLSWTGARGRAYRCPPELGHEPDLDHLAALVTPRTKLLVINSPSNPTGAVYSRATVEALAAFAARHDLWLLSDECYDELVFDGEHVSPAFYDDDGRVITAFTFSKTYAMTGWRIGYATGSRELITNAAKVLESNTSCPPSVSQKAAEAALTGPREPIDAMRDSYRARRDAVVAQLSEAGLLTAVPHGAFYVMAGLGDSALDAREFALRLLREQAVAVAPGTAFGDTATRAVRISLASSFEDLTLGIERLVDLTRATA